MMRIDVITIFPGMFDAVLQESILKRAQQKKKVKIVVHDLRPYTEDKHGKVDDRPFGGGPGMVMTPQPIFSAIKAIKGRRKATVVLMSPSGKTLTQGHAKKLAKLKNIIIICGRYEGIDDRVRQFCVDETLSIGDYVLTGGELPAMVFIDCVARLVPGVLGKEESLHNESFEGGLLEYPQYTRPANFQGKKIPEVLLSGNHHHIEKWRREEALKRTQEDRPDLLNQIGS